MIQRRQTIVTNEDLEKQAEAHAVDQKQTFVVTDTREVAGGYPKASEETLKEIGQAQAIKQASEKDTLNTNKFNTLVQTNSSKTLLKIKTAKILDFFPDEVVIETTKINVSKRNYFFMRQLHTIAIEDIGDVFVETTPIYATLKIIDKFYVENTVEVKFLKKDDAKKARRIIQGLVSAYKGKIDIATLPNEGLVEKLEILGSGGAVENTSD